MLPFFRPKNDKDIADKLVGKRRKYRLARNGSSVAVTGTLLAFYRREVLPDGLMPPAGGRVELFAVFITQAGRFFCYYIVSYPESEDIAGCQEYAHVCPDFDAVRAFLAAMAYPGKTRFADALLAAAGKTLAGLSPGKAGQTAAQGDTGEQPQPREQPEEAGAAPSAADVVGEIPRAAKPKG